MNLPSDSDLRLELQALSQHQFGPIDRAGDLAPTRKVYDRHRDMRWVGSQALLSVFGLPDNHYGWTRLMWSFGFLVPTMGDVRQADHRARQSERSARYRALMADEYYPALQGEVSYEEVFYVDLGDGTYRKTTRTYISLR